MDWLLKQDVGLLACILPYILARLRKPEEVCVRVCVCLCVCVYVCVYVCA